MRIQFLSDIHFDVAPPKPVVLAPDVDLIVAAGDICEGMIKAFRWLRETFPSPVPIVTVPGNHSFYRGCLPDELALARTMAPEFAITFLEDDIAFIGGVRFIGATLWTDYLLFGEELAPLAMRAARDGLLDHRLITWRKKPWQRFRPEEARRLHLQSRSYIEAMLKQDFSGPSVVVTHHAPHPRSIPPIYRNSLFSPAFASNLEDLIWKGRPTLWLHGHVHSGFDYQIEATRVLCNPHGYGAENPGFDPALVVEV